MELSEIKGLGPKSIQKLRESGIETPEDFACIFPRKYIDATKINKFGLLEEGDEAAAEGKLINVQKKFARKGIFYVIADFLTPDGIAFRAVWFNQNYICRVLKPQNSYFLTGKLKKHAQGDTPVEISAPTIIPPSRKRPVITVYKNMGLGAAKLQSAMHYVLDGLELNGCVSDAIRRKFGLVNYKKAFLSAHFPNSIREARAARKSLSLEHLAAFISQFFLVKQRGKKDKPFSYGDKSGLKKLAAGLDFELTVDQKNAVNRIITLMDGAKPINVLLEGDVGCGKTIVCFFALAYAATAGKQCVLMAPTEILALQHYKNAARLFGDMFGENSVRFLASSVSAAEKEAVKQDIKSGGAKIIIGTHSVLSKDIIFKNLTLIVADEQHRFGVNQRAALENKGQSCDTIVMSATPIPRTLALAMYGDLELISIRTKPKAKATVFTRFVSQKIGEMYDYILKKAQLGEQTFIVCPRIDSDDDELISAEDLFKELKKGVLKDYVALLHGKMRDERKREVLNSFISGEKRVLVTTTIVEVGIDIPRATTMVVYNAERYGLSQLHQLRGRIGRGTIDSFCFLLASSESYLTRLKFLEECADGFLLAEKDFELRGAGDFLGVHQHGKSLAFGGEPITAELLKKAKQIADEIVNLGVPVAKEQELFLKELALN